MKNGPGLSKSLAPDKDTYSYILSCQMARMDSKLRSIHELGHFSQIPWLKA
jgi:hypothetical protein